MVMTVARWRRLVATPPPIARLTTGPRAGQENAPGARSGGVGVIWYRIPDSNR